MKVFTGRWGWSETAVLRSPLLATYTDHHLSTRESFQLNAGTQPHFQHPHQAFRCLQYHTASVISWIEAQYEGCPIPGPSRERRLYFLQLSSFDHNYWVMYSFVLPFLRNAGDRDKVWTFGGGPRQCIGRHLSNTLLKVDKLHIGLNSSQANWML